MNTTTTSARWTIRLTGTIQIVLGLLFWSGHADALIPVHVVVGLILVLALWTLALIAARADVNRGLVVLSAVWGLIVPVLGLAQTRLLTGDAHWVIQVVHLLVGLGAIGQGERLAREIRGHLATPPRSPQFVAGERS